MSQIYKNLSGGGTLPSNVPTSFVTDNGTAVPLANVLIIHATDSSINVAAGIIADGGTPATANSNEVDIVLTNRVRGTLKTTNNIPTVVNLFSLGATPGTYNFTIQVAAYDITDALGAGYNVFAAVRTNGTTAFLIGEPAKDVFEEPSTVLCDANIFVTGNNVYVQVTGLGSTTIHWDYLANYIFVS